MIDFWFTFGAMVVDTGLLDDIVRFRPAFTRAKLKIVETTAQGDVETQLPAGGKLDETSTTKLRQMIRNSLLANYSDAAPPVSLYTAAKLCQLVNADLTNLTDGLRKGHWKYIEVATAEGIHRPSRGLITLVGLCIIDDKLCLRLLKPEGMAVGQEFGVTPDAGNPEWRLIQKLCSGTVADNAFLEGQKTLRSGSSWDAGCREVFEYYDDFEMAAN